MIEDKLMELNTAETIKAYKALTPDARWDRMYEAAEGFINKEGKLPPTDYQVNGVTLINWIRSHSSTNQKNEEKRNKVKKILAESGVLSPRDHWDTYFPMLQEHLSTKIPLRYATDKKFQEWARDLKRRWHDENIDETKRSVLVEADYEYLIVEDMLTYELLKEFYRSCDDIELYKFNNEIDDESMEVSEVTFDILSFLKRELVKRDNNELTDKKIKVLSLFDKFDLKMTSSQKVIKEIIKDEIQKPFVMQSIEPALRQVYQLSVDTVFERTNNDHFKMMINILDSKNQTEIAGMCGLTKERVRQLFNIIKDQFKVDLKNNIKLFKSAKI
jgi:hypothetical protein